MIQIINAISHTMMCVGFCALSCLIALSFVLVFEIVLFKVIDRFTDWRRNRRFR